MISFQISPHEHAPLFADLDEGRLVLQQLVTTLAGGNFSTANEEVRTYLRQASLVNLWFFLRFIASHTGPYDKLNTTLHLDMCNFRQHPSALAPGARDAHFIPRSHFKSSIFTHGASAWELIRNPNLRIRITNAVYDKARSFMWVAKQTFDSNDFFKWLFGNPSDPMGSFVPSSKSPRWNENEIVLPNRDRKYVEPSIQPSGATAAAEGSHHDLLIIDDLVGLEDLDKDHRISISMLHAENWYMTNSNALLVSPRQSRISVVATRYAVDDVYHLMTDDCREVVGVRDDAIKIVPDGTWRIYYRKAIEDGHVIFPENFDPGFFDKLAQTDFWTWITQYQNDPTASGNAELAQYEPRSCSLKFDIPTGQWHIQTHPDPNFPDTYDDLSPPPSIPLSQCDVVMTVDPAGTESGIKAMTSRTSIGVWALDGYERYFRIWSRVGYFNINEMFDYIFEGNEAFRGHVRATYIESNAMQKVLKPLIEREELTRNCWVNPQSLPAQGDKKARIRAALSMPLKRGNIFLADGCGIEFREELRKFGVSSSPLDCLDESEKAFAVLSKPGTSQDYLDAAYEEEDREFGDDVSSNAFGY